VAHREAATVARFVPGPQLLAVAGHDEQAVVDGQAQAEGRREVEGVDRHVGQIGHHAQHEERADDRQHADGQGQGGGDDAAEDEHEQDERDGQGDELGLGQVLLERLADLPERLGVAPDADGDRTGVVAVDAEPRGQLADALVEDVLVRGVEQADDQSPPPVLGAQRRGAALGPVRHDAPHVGLVRQSLRQVAAGLGNVGVVDVALFGGDQQDQVGYASTEPLVEQVLGLRRLGGRVLEATGDQPVGHAAAEDAGDGEEDDGADEDEPGAAGDEAGDGGQHRTPRGASETGYGAGPLGR
jgi:hypothetical protein